MSITAYSIERVYAHRIAADPTTCPVCCGDKCHTDPRYGSEVLYTVEAGSCGHHNVYRCEACEVYHASRESA